MSNTDGEDTQRIKLTPRDAGYKYFTCPMCDGQGQIGQDQHDQNNRDVECQIETVQELASLREELKQKGDSLEFFIDNTKLQAEMLKHQEETLKQQEEVIRELIEALVSASECLESEGYQQFPEEINAVIKNAKSLTTKDK